MKRTSLEAYNNLVAVGKIPPLRMRVLRYIHTHQGCTQPEISMMLGESARKRVSELLWEKIVFEIGEVRINGIAYTTYGTAEKSQMEIGI